MAKDYFAWVGGQDEFGHNDPVPENIIQLAKREAPHTIKILFPAAQTAFVNVKSTLFWAECVACYAVEEQCPEHGTHADWNGDV